MRLHSGILKRDVNPVLAAVPRSILFPDFDQVGKGTPLFDAAHLREVSALCPKVPFNFLASQPRLEILGVRLES